MEEQAEPQKQISKRREKRDKHESIAELKSNNLQSCKFNPKSSEGKASNETLKESL